VAGHIFQARPVWIYTQSNITNIILKKIFSGSFQTVFGFYPEPLHTEPRHPIVTTVYMSFYL
jgi:hypothetical protein